MNNQESRPKPKTGSRKKVQVRAKNGTFAPKLTRKQKAFADLLIAQPKASATEIVRQTYNVSDNNTAGVIAAENLRKPSIQLYLDSHIDKAKQRIVQLVDSEREDIALRASQDIIDRTHGKPTQIQQSQSISFIQHLSNKNIDI